MSSVSMSRALEVVSLESRAEMLCTTSQEITLFRAEKYRTAPYLLIINATFWDRRYLSA